MFFTVVTRTLAGRETLLSRCEASVRGQTLAHVEHIIVKDEQGVGVSEAQKMLWTVSPKGDYVLVLDDDDYLSSPDALARVRDQLVASQPPFAVVKVAHGELGPMPRNWGMPPCSGAITVSNVVVASWIWMSTRQNFGVRYTGDWDWIESLFAARVPAWIDVEVVTVEKRRMGARS